MTRVASSGCAVPVNRQVVAADDMGDVFRHDLRAVGVTYETCRATRRAAGVLIVVTPDAQRTYEHVLGVSRMLVPDDVDEALVAAGQQSCTSRAYLFDRGRRQGGAPQGVCRRPCRGGRSRYPSPTRLRGPPPRGLPRPRRRGRWTSCSATRKELMALYEARRFEDALHAVRRRLRRLARHRGKEGPWWSAGRHGAGRRASRGRSGGHHGAGDLYAAGFSTG